MSDPGLAPLSRASVPQWVAVVSIVIGCLGILCWGGQGLRSMFASTMTDVPQNQPPQSSGHRAFEAGGYIAGVLLGLWLIVAGSGSVSGAAWGRTGLRIWAVARIVVAIIGVLGAIYWLDEVVAASFQAMQADLAQGDEAAAATPPLTEESLRAFTIGAIAVTTIAVCIWPILVLATTRRRQGA
ncbi:MAG: hypothetical protein QF561_02730 [Phycisphaerales bacterium]|nr:hypothetical protein [Phycisphaerales bacterium]